MNSSQILKNDSCIYLDAHVVSGDDIDPEILTATRLRSSACNLMQGQLNIAMRTLEQNLALDPKSDYVLKMTLEIRKEELC